jgi:hypothetical protein
MSDHIYLWLYSPLLRLDRFFSLFIFTQLVRLLGRWISPSLGRYLHTGQHKQNKRTQTSMPQVGFEVTIPAFEPAKTVYVLDRAATVMGSGLILQHVNLQEDGFLHLEVSFLSILQTP